MAISVGCAACGSRLNAPDAAAGRQVRCPKCAAPITVPYLPEGKSSPPKSMASTPRAADQPDSRSDRHASPPVDDNSFIARNLLPGERLLYITRIHPLVMMPPALLAACSLVAGIIGLIVGERGIAFGVGGGLVFLLALILVLLRLVERKTTEYVCTDRRIVIRSGILTTRLREMPLAKVEALLLKQSVFGRLFGYGTLVFKGSGGTRRTCENIQEPDRFHRQIQEQVASAQGAGASRYQ